MYEIYIFYLSTQETASGNVFTGEEEVFAFERTVSRLAEMQGKEYWAQWLAPPQN